MSETKRPRLRGLDLETINDALGCYIKSLEDQLAKHDENEGRFKDQDEWLQRREKLRWLLTNAKHAQVKIEMNLKGVECGRTPEPLRHLLNVTAEDKPGEYIRALKALPMLPYGDIEKDFNALLRAVDEDVVSSFRDPDDDGLLMVRKLDVMRLAAYLEVHG